MALASQLTGAAGATLRSGMRVQTRSDEDGLWYCGTLHEIFADGSANIECDSGEWWQGEGEDVHVLPQHHPGFVQSALTFGGAPGFEGPDGPAGAVQDDRSRKQRSAPPMASTAAPMAAEPTVAVPGAAFTFGSAASAIQQPGFSFGTAAPGNNGHGGFTFGASPSVPGAAPAPSGFTFGAPPPPGGFTFGPS